MSKRKMIKYLQNELRNLHKEYVITQEKWDKASIKERIIMADNKDNIEEKYYRFYMICCDLGILPNDL